MPFSRGSSQPRDQIRISWVSCIVRCILYHQHLLGSPTQSHIQWLILDISWSLKLLSTWAFPYGLPYGTSRASLGFLVQWWLCSMKECLKNEREPNGILIAFYNLALKVTFLLHSFSEGDYKGFLKFQGREHRPSLSMEKQQHHILRRVCVMQYILFQPLLDNTICSSCPRLILANWPLTKGVSLQQCPMETSYGPVISIINPAQLQAWALAPQSCQVKYKFFSKMNSEVVIFILLCNAMYPQLQMLNPEPLHQGRGQCFCNCISCKSTRYTKPIGDKQVIDKQRDEFNREDLLFSLLQELAKQRANSQEGKNISRLEAHEHKLETDKNG